MRFIISIFLTALLAFAACIFLPWYSIAIMAFIVAIAVKQRPSFSFLSAFIGLFLLWGGHSFIVSTANNNLMAHKISMLIIKGDNPILLILITALIGALVAGLAALSASLLFNGPGAETA